MHHPQVVLSPIINYFLKVRINSHTESQLVPNLLFQGSVRELHNNLVSATIYVGLNEEQDEDDNMNMSDSALQSILPPQF